jgi:hypothetical protein
MNHGWTTQCPATKQRQGNNHHKRHNEVQLKCTVGSPLRGTDEPQRALIRMRHPPLSLCLTKLSNDETDNTEHPSQIHATCGYCTVWNPGLMTRQRLISRPSSLMKRVQCDNAVPMNGTTRNQGTPRTEPHGMRHKASR